MSTRLFAFAGGSDGDWRVTNMTTVAGEPLASVSHVTVLSETPPQLLPVPRWTLRGITSNERYVTRDEKTGLVEKQPGLGRPEAVCAALIPIRKTAAWWSLPQDERRKIFEEQSNHVRTGMRFLPAIARRLHHCRDLGSDEPFDFLTWFEYAPADAAAFDQLVAQLRASPEWAFVSRETDIRLEQRAQGQP
jgi:Chlorite dismutase